MEIAFFWIQRQWYTSLLKESLYFIFHLLSLPDTHRYFLWGIQHKAFWELWRNHKQRAWNTLTGQSGAPKLSAAQRAAHLCKMRMRKCQRQNNIENVGETQKVDFWFKTGRRSQSCLIWVTNYPLSDISPSYLFPCAIPTQSPQASPSQTAGVGVNKLARLSLRIIQKIRPLANDIYLGLLFYDKHHKPLTLLTTTLLIAAFEYFDARVITHWGFSNELS